MTTYLVARADVTDDKITQYVYTVDAEDRFDAVELAYIGEGLELFRTTEYDYDPEIARAFTMEPWEIVGEL